LFSPAALTSGRETGFGLSDKVCRSRVRGAPQTLPSRQAGRKGWGEVTGERAAKIEARDLEICGVALKMLRNQFYRETIPRYLEKLDASEAGSGIASKTGSLDRVRADVAIVTGKTGPMVLSIFTYENEDKSWTVDNEGEILIARLARQIVEKWSPAGLDGKTMVPGLDLSPRNTAPARKDAPGASK